MLELANLSNVSFEVESLLGGDKAVLEGVLARHQLAGLELFFWGERDEALFPRAFIRGVHLRFWPVWVSFWRQDAAGMARDYGDGAAVARTFGASRIEDWLEIWRQNIGAAVAAGAEYLVLHVAETPLLEMCARPFTTVRDETVIDAALELVAALADEIPDGCRLLFENLWWPGLTLRRADLVERLLTRSAHRNCGLMMDTGHLMSTNLDLIGEEDSADFVVSVYRSLGSLGREVYGLHLHQSQSGAYVRAMQEAHRGQRWPRETADILEYVSRVDTHQPFQTEAVRRIVEAVEPVYLVHEFLSSSLEDWERKLHLQRHGLGWE